MKLLRSDTSLTNFCQKSPELTYLYRQWVADQLNFVQFSKDKTTLLDLPEEDLITFMTLASPDGTIPGFIKAHVTLDQLDKYFVRKIYATDYPAYEVEWITDLERNRTISPILTDYVKAVYDDPQASELDRALAQFCVRWHRAPQTFATSLNSDLLDNLLMNEETKWDTDFLCSLLDHIPATPEYASARQQLPRLLASRCRYSPYVKNHLDGLLASMSDTDPTVIYAIVQEGGQLDRFNQLNDLDLLVSFLTDDACQDALRRHEDPQVRTLVAIASARIRNQDVCQHLLYDESPLVLTGLLIGGYCHPLLTSYQEDTVQETITMLMSQYEELANMRSVDTGRFYTTSEADIHQFVQNHLGKDLPSSDIPWLRFTSC